MENLIYSLNATVPVFLVIVAGYIFKKAGWINDGFINASNKITFTVTLPLLLVQDMMNNHFLEEFELKYVLYCAGVTTLCFIAVTVAAKIFLKDKSIVAEFVQASYRSSAAILGTAFVLNSYGNTGMVPLMIIGAVPLYNIYAVLILTLECPDKGAVQENAVKKTLKGIITNPIIIGIVVGVLFSALQVKFPPMLDNTVSSLAKSQRHWHCLPLVEVLRLERRLRK